MTENNLAMNKAEMKLVLKTKKPVRFAYGTSKDGFALKMATTRMARALLVEMAELDLKGTAFGTAERDAEDATKLNMSVNKLIAGSAKRLTKALKGTGIKRVALTDSEGGAESHEDDEPDEAEDAAGSSILGASGDPAVSRPLPPIPAARPNATAPTPTPSQTVPPAVTPTATATPPPATTQPATTQPATTQPAAPAATDLPGRMRAVLNRMKADGNTDPTLLRAIKSAQAYIGANDTAAATKLIAAAEAKAGLGSAPAAQPNAPVKSPDQVSYEQARMRAKGDLDTARANKLPTTAQDRTSLATTVASMDGKAATGDFKGALALVAPARKLAVRVMGAAMQNREQQDTYTRMQGPLQKVQQTYFTKAAGDMLRKEKLSPGKEFKAFTAAMTAFESARDSVTLDAMEGAAKVYLAHYDNDLSERQQGHKESLRKKQVCETSLKQAGHMRLALTMQDLGPPPWDERKSLKASSVRAQFSFESLGVPAAPLPNGEGGVSAAFWVKGYESGATKPDGSPDTDAEGKDFLFKPAAGEQDVTPFKAGDSTPREAVTKALTDKIALMTGLDLGVPQTSVVSLPPDSINLEAYNKAKREAVEDGSAPEGLLDQRPQTGSLQQFRSSNGSIKDQLPGFAATVPQSECEKASVLDILSLNTDRHGGNFMVGRRPTPGGGTEPTLIPIDHGLTLPGREQMRERGSDRMNEASTNALLAMPGSYQPFSPEMQDRIAMLDPAAIEAAVMASVAAVDQAYPDLGAASRIGNDSAALAKRSALFLKRACGRLSPAMIQMALASRQDEIFDSDDQAFPGAADAVIADYDREKAAIEAFVLSGTELDAFRLQLKGLGFPDLSTTGAARAQFKRWFAKNATFLMAAVRNGTAYAGQPPSQKYS